MSNQQKLGDDLLAALRGFDQNFMLIGNIQVGEFILCITRLQESASHMCKELPDRDSDAQLMEFYGVNGLHQLIDAMEKHIEGLQAKLPKLNQPAVSFARA